MSITLSRVLLSKSFKNLLTSKFKIGDKVSCKFSIFDQEPVHTGYVEGINKWDNSLILSGFGSKEFRVECSQKVNS